MGRRGVADSRSGAGARGGRAAISRTGLPLLVVLVALVLGSSLGLVVPFSGSAAPAHPTTSPLHLSSATTPSGATSQAPSGPGASGPNSPSSTTGAQGSSTVSPAERAAVEQALAPWLPGTSSSVNLPAGSGPTSSSPAVASLTPAIPAPDPSTASKGLAHVAATPGSSASSPLNTALPNPLAAPLASPQGSRGAAGPGVPSTGYGAGTDIGFSGQASGGPVNAPYQGPSITEDTSGNIYVAFSSDVSATGWGIYSAKSLNGGTSFTVQFIAAAYTGPYCTTGGGSGTCELVSPTIVATPTASDVCIVYLAISSVTSVTWGDYFHTCATNYGGSATTGSWSAATGDTAYGAMCSVGTLWAGFAIDFGIVAPVAAFDNAGNLLVGAWGDYPAASCTSFGFMFDVWTSGTTFKATYEYNLTEVGGCWTANCYYVGAESLECSLAVASCAVSLGVSDATPANWYQDVIVSTTDFSAITYGPMVVATHAFTTSYNTVPIEAVQGDIAYAPSGTNVALTYILDTTTTPTSFDIQYAYSTNDFASVPTTGPSPDGSVTGAGVSAITVEGAGAAPFVAWQNPSALLVVTAATSLTGTWGTIQTAALGGYEPGMATYIPTTAPPPWRDDIVYTTTQTTAQSEYIGLDGPYLTGAATTPTLIDVGEPTSLSATANAGIAAYSYSWSGLPTGCTSSNADPLTCAPSSSGTGTFSAMVLSLTDGWGFTAKATMPTLTVDSALVAGAIAPASPAIDSGQSITLTSAPSGGTAVYTYQWYTGSACSTAIASATASTYTANPIATTTYSYKVTDTSLGSPNYKCSAGDTVTVNSALVAGAASPSSATIDSGQSILLTSIAPSGGTPPYTYAWRSGTSATCSSDTAVAGQTTSTYAPAPTVATYYCVQYGDASAGTPTAVVYSNVVLVTVKPALVAGAVTPSSATIDSGQTITLSSTAPSGGTPTYTYAWRAGASATCTSDGVVTGQTNATYLVSPTASTYYCAQYGDSSVGTPAAVVYSNVVSVTVNSALVPGSVSPSIDTIDSGQSLVLTANPSGGTTPYSYQWYSSSSSSGSCTAGTAAGTSSSLTVSPTASTYYCYHVGDSSVGSPAAGGVSVWQLVTVNGALVAGAVSPSSAMIDTGQTITLSSSAPTSGTPTYTYAWRSGTSATCSSDTAVAGQTTSTYAPAPTVATYYCVQYGDASVGTPVAVVYSNVVLVTVNPALVAGSVTPASPTIDTGQSVALSSSAPTGGTPTYYTYQWRSGPSPTCSSDAVVTGQTSSTYSPTPAGNTYYCVQYGDASQGTPAAVAYSTAVLVTVNPALNPGSVGPAAATLDSGQSITLSANPSGGTVPYTYQWYLSSSSSGTCTLGTVGATTSTFTVSPTTNTYYCYHVGDSSVGTPAASQVSAWSLVTVNPALNVGTASPPSPSIDSGQSITLTANPSGGTAPYSYQWYSSSSNTGVCAAGTAGPTTATFAITPAAATYYCYHLTDSSSGTPAASPSSPWDLVTVNVPLVAGTVSPGAPALDNGQSITLSSAPSGGTPAYHYQWYSASANTGICTAGTSGPATATFVVSPTANTYYCYHLTDSSSGTPAAGTSSTWALVTVNPALAPGSATPPAPAIDNGQSISLTANPSGGTPTYTYHWYSSASNGGSCSAGTAGGTTATVSVSPTSTLYYCYVVGDSSQGTPAASAVSGWDLVTVNPALVPGAVSPTTPIIDNGQQITLTANPSRGTAAYTYQWYSSSVNTGLCTSGSVGGTSATYLPAPSSNTYYCYVVGDSSVGTPAASAMTSWDLVTVNPALVPGSATPNSPIINAGQAVTLTANASGGTTPYTYQWYSSPLNSGTCASGTAGPTTSTYTSYPSANTYYCYAVRDASVGSPAALGYSTWDLVTVNGPLVGGSVSPASPFIDAGQSIPLGANPSGGTAPYTYLWYSSTSSSGACTAGTAGGTGSPTTVTPTANMYYCYQVTDNTGATQTSAWDLVTVNAALVAGAVSPVTPKIDAGQSITLTANPSAGTSPYTYQWYSSASSSGACSTGTPGGTSSTFATTPAANAYYCYVVGDSSQGTPAASASSGWDLVTVNGALVAGPVSPSAPSIDVGQSLTLTANPSSGTSPYSYQWFTGTACGTSVSGATFATLSVSPSSTTSYSYRVTDSAYSPVSKCSVVDTVTVNVALAAGAVSPSAPVIDSGQSITLASNPSGGTPAYTYQWYSSTTGSGTCSSGTSVGSTATVAPSPTSDTYYCYAVGDSAKGSPAASSSTAWSLVTVDPALAAGAASPPAPAIDSGQSITLTSAPSGGTAPYSVQWYFSTSNGGACSSGTAGPSSTTYAISPTATTYYCYVASDSSQGSPAAISSSAWDLVTVHPTLVAGSATPAAPIIDGGQTITLTANPSAGTSPYTYQWHSSSSNTGTCASGTPGPTTSTDGASPASNTYYCYVVGDSSVGSPAASASSSWTLVTVNPALVAGSATPNSPTINSGQPVTLTANPSGGTPAYTYQWYYSQLNTGTCASGTAGASTASYTSSPTVNTYYCYAVGDASQGTPAALGYSAWDMVTVNGPLVGGVVSPASPALDLGQSISLGANPSGGTAPYTYSWFSSSSNTGTCTAGTAGATGSPTTVNPSASTYYCYQVRDNTGATQSSAWDLVTVHPALVAGSATPAAPFIDVGQTITLTANPSAGTSPYTYQWYSSSSSTGACSTGTAGGTGSTFAPTPAANAYYCYVVGDSSQGTPVASVSSGWVLVTANAALAAGAVTPSAPAIDVGQSLTLTANPSSGTSPYTYHWYSSSTGTGACSSGTAGPSTSTFSATPVSATYYCYVAGDASVGSPAASASSTWDLLTVNPALTAGGATPSAPVIDAGQSIALTASPAGGTSPYAEQWYSSTSGTGSCWSGAAVGTSATISASPAASTYYCYVATDASLGTPATNASSPWNLVKVDPALVAGAVTPTLPTLDRGQSVTLTASASGGTPAYTYQWFASSSSSGACGSGTMSGSSLTVTVTPSASTYYCYVAGDGSVGTPAAAAPSGWDLVTVNPLPTLTLTRGTPQVDVGETANVTGTVAGGTPGFTCTWYVNGVQQAGSNCLGTAYAASSALTLTVNATIVDSLGGRSSSAPVTIVVSIDPTASVSPTTSNIDAGQSATLTPTITGGSSPDTCQWYLNGSAIAGATSCTVYRFVPARGGPYQVGFSATDAATGPLTAWSNATVVALPALVASASPQTVILDMGMAQPFTVTAAGGIAPYTYQWYLNLTPIAGATSASYPFVPTGPGSDRLTVRVADSHSGVLWVNVSATVYPSISVAISPSSPSSVAPGAPLPFTATSYGGAPPATYLWFVNGAVQSGATGPSFSFSSSTPGTYTVNVTLLDALGHVARSASVPVVVAAPLSASLALSQATVDVGMSAWFNVSVSGGLPPYTLAWTLNGATWTAPGASALSYQFDATSAGTFAVQVTVTDSLSGRATTAVETLTVNAPLSVALAANTTSTHVGWTVVLTATSAGGTGPLHFVWLLNGSTIGSATSSGYDLLPSGAGNYSFQVRITDALGRSAISSVVVVEASRVASQAHTGGNGGSTGAGFPWWIVLLIVVVLLGLALLFFLLRRRRKMPAKAEEPGPSDSAGLAEGSGPAALGEAAAVESLPVASSDFPGATPAAEGTEAPIAPTDEATAPDPSSIDAPTEPASPVEMTPPPPPPPEHLPAPPPPPPPPAPVDSEAAVPAIEPMPPEVPRAPPAETVPAPEPSSVGEVPVVPPPPPPPPPPPVTGREESQGGVIPAGTPPEMLEAAVAGEAEPHPSTEHLTKCPECGSPLPTARSDCYVCGWENSWASGSRAGPASAAGAPAAPAASVPPPPSPPPAPPAPPKPSTSAPSAAPAPARSAPSQPAAHSSGGKHPTHCFICRSELSAEGSCPICGVQWAEK